jgi:hypothetical protein
VSALAALAWMAGTCLTLGAAAVSGIVSDEFRARLDRIPYGLLRTAIGRLPQDVHADVGEEWRTELDHILHRAEAFPLTRLLLGIRFALGLLRAAPVIGKDLVGVRARCEEEEFQSKITAQAAPRLRVRLDHDPVRWRTWRNRLAVTAITGLIMTILLNWQVGVTLAIMVALVHMLMKSRAVAIQPSATHVQTMRLLSALRPEQYVCLHHLAMPGTGEKIDHLIIGASGIRILIPQQWDRRLSARADPAGAQLYHGRVCQNAVLDAARQQAADVGELINAELGMTVPVIPGVLILGSRLFRNAVPVTEAVQVRSVDVFGPSAARRWLQQPQDTIAAAERENLAAAAARIFVRQPLPPGPSEATPNPMPRQS